MRRFKNLIFSLLAVTVSIGGLCILGIKEQPQLVKWYCQRQGGDDVDVDSCIESHQTLLSLKADQ